LSLFGGLGKWGFPLRKGGVLTKTAKELIALVAALVVLVGSGVAYAANTYRAHFSATKGGPPG
jgi:hypothetical protein